MDPWSNFDWTQEQTTTPNDSDATNNYESDGGGMGNNGNGRSSPSPHQQYQQANHWISQQQVHQHDGQQIHEYYPEQETLSDSEPLPFHPNLYNAQQQQPQQQQRAQDHLRQGDNIFGHFAHSQPFQAPSLQQYKQQSQDRAFESNPHEPAAVTLDSIHEFVDTEQSRQTSYQRDMASSTAAHAVATATSHASSLQPLEEEVGDALPIERSSPEREASRNVHDYALPNVSQTRRDEGNELNEPFRKKLKREHPGDTSENRVRSSSVAASQLVAQEDENKEAYLQFAQPPSAESAHCSETFEGSFPDGKNASSKAPCHQRAANASFRTDGEAGNVDELINGLFEDPSFRESFASNASNAVPVHSDVALNETSIVDENDADLGEAKLLPVSIRKQDSGVSSDPGVDLVELPSTLEGPPSTTVEVAAAAAAATAITSAVAGAASTPHGQETVEGPSTKNEENSQETVEGPYTKNEDIDPILNTSLGHPARNTAQPSSKATETSRQTVLSAPADVNESTSTSDARASSDSKKTAESKPKKPKPTPRPLKKPIAVPTAKETSTAKALLGGKTDLSLVLPKNASWFLAREFWMFTVQQFESIFDESTESYNAPGIAERRKEIMDEMGTRIAYDEKAKPSFDIDCEPAQNDFNNLEATALEAMLVVPQSARQDGSTKADQTASQTESAAKTVQGTSKGEVHGPPSEFDDNTGMNVDRNCEDCSPYLGPLATKADDSTTDSLQQTSEDVPPMDDTSHACHPSQESAEVSRREQALGVDDEALVPCNDATISANVQQKGTVDDDSGRSSVEANDKQILVDRILETWKKRVEKWKSDAPQLSEEEMLERSKTSFSLQGPVGVLLPEIVSNFLSSISVSTLSQFLSIRFTESSPGIQAMTVWRQLCELKQLKAGPLARHMAGLVTRIDKALTSAPPADAYTRTWMGTALVCLTATSKDFLIGECKLKEPNDFLNVMTKTFSERLVKWRELKQLSVLKGSGKVAMVSSWKAAVRESVAAESTAEKGAGRVTSEDEIVQLSQSLSPIDHTESDDTAQAKSTKPTKPKPEKKNITKKKQKVTPDLTEAQRHMMGLALKSTEFLQKVLPTDTVEFLAKMDIRTPEHLLNANKVEDSPLILELVKWKTAASGEQAQTSSSARLLSDWTVKVKRGLKRFAVGDTRESANIHVRSLQVVEKGTSTKMKKPNEDKSRMSHVRRKNLSDPLDALSATALRFLESIGIATGDDFLSTRTSEMANAFAKWREEEKMVTLKGSGHSATISGWKASVRKAAEMMGDDDVASRDATETLVPARTSQAVKAPPASPKINRLSHPTLLDGNRRRLFLVRNSNDPRCMYEFELSVRKGRGLNVYLTYRGAKQVLGQEKEPFHPAVIAGDSGSTGERGSSFLPVLQDVADVFDSLSHASSSEPFLASRPGCGLIEVSKYGAVPLPKEKTHFVSQFDPFLLNKSDEKSGPKGVMQRGLRNANVLVEESPETGNHCFFYASKPLEKGQVVELQFSSNLEHLDMSGVAEQFVLAIERMSLVRKISSRYFSDLRALVDRISSIASSTKSDTGKKANPHEEPGACQENFDASEALTLQIVKRRIHWLATLILRRLEESEGKFGATADQHQLLIDDTKKLLMTMDDRRNLCSFFNQSGDSSVLEELSTEILCDAIMRNALGRYWSQKSSWCSVSSKLLNHCLRKASMHLLTGCMNDGKSAEDVICEIETLVFDAVKRVISWERDLGELSFEIQPDPRRDGSCSSVDWDFVVRNHERLPKDVVATASQVAAYVDAVELCDETAFEGIVHSTLRERAAEGFQVVATSAPWPCSSPVMRSIQDVRDESASLNVKWYIENQILSVAHAIASNEIFQSASDETGTGTESGCSYARLARVARRILEADPTDDRRPSLEQPILESTTELVFVPEAELVPANPAVPTTLPLFLAVVWPVLRRIYGWSMEVGDDPDDILFYPPGLKGQFHGSERHISIRRLERARKRVKVQQHVQEVGFGALPKLTKRVFISASRNDLKPGNGVTVKAVLKQFVASVLSGLSGEDDAECRKRMVAIEEAVGQCFDELIPSMLPQDHRGPSDSANLECAYLMQVLLVLPSLLEQSGLSMRRIEETLGVIRDLAQFVSSKNEELFEQPLRVSHEEYEPGSEVVRPFLLPRMQTFMPKLSNGNGNEPEVVRELIQPEDMKDLSGFIGTTLSQFVPCRATEIDIMKGRKAIHVGWPGIMCRHCAGVGTEGKYFFSSLDSFNTAATGVLGHVYKCPYISEDLKKTIASLKTRHSNERQRLKHGAQAAFYSQLWKRLWSSTGDIQTPVVLANHRKLVAEEGQPTPVLDASPEDDEDGPVVTFTHHTDLLNYITTTSPWNDRSDLAERIQQYYDCISFGGELYNTNAMPKNFSAEWILHKRVPPERLSTKRSFLSG